MYFPDVPSPAWATSPASLASSASLAGADVDDADGAGDVAQEVLRMQKRTQGESNTPMFFSTVFRTAPKRKDLVERLGITASYVDKGEE